MLNFRQQKFVQGVLAGKNGVQAYIDAGYEARGHAAEVNAARLLRNAEVSAAVTAAKQKAAAAFDVTAERVVRGLAAIAFADIRRLFRDDGTLKRVSELDEDTAAAVSSLASSERGRPTATRSLRHTKSSYGTSGGRWWIWQSTLASSTRQPHRTRPIRWPPTRRTPWKSWSNSATLPGSPRPTPGQLEPSIRSIAAFVEDDIE